MKVLFNVSIRAFRSYIPNNSLIKCDQKCYAFTSTSLQHTLGEHTGERWKVGKRHTVDTLGKLFKINKFDALAIASKYKTLCSTPPETLCSNYMLYKSNKIKVDTILEYPDLLTQKNATEKINYLEKMDINLNDICPLLKIDYNRLKHLEKSDLVTRIQYMSVLFQRPIRTVCGYVAEKTFLMYMDLDKLQDNVNLLKKFGITNDEIVNDLWVLRYSPDTISERLEEAKSHNVEAVKTWMVRAPPEIVDRYVNRRSENKLILGNNSIAEYLSDRLDCSVQQANYLISKHPALENKSLKKMQEIIDFLYSYGFKPFHLCRVPKILLHSVDTTKKRLRELQTKGLQIESLSILTKSQKQYMQYYEGLVKANKMKNKS